MNKMGLIEKTRILELENVIKKYIELDVKDEIIFKKGLKNEEFNEDSYEDFIIGLFEIIIGIKTASIKKDIENTCTILSSYECGETLKLVKKIDRSPTILGEGFNENNYEGKLTEIENKKINEIINNFIPDGRILEDLLKMYDDQELGFVKL